MEFKDFMEGKKKKKVLTTSTTELKESIEEIKFEELETERIVDNKSELNFVGSFNYVPDPIEYNEGSIYKNINEGVAYIRKGLLWEELVRDGKPGRDAARVGGSGVGVTEVKSITCNLGTFSSQVDLNTYTQENKNLVKIGTTATVSNIKKIYSGDSIGWEFMGSRLFRLKKLTHENPILPTSAAQIPTLTTSGAGGPTMITSGSTLSNLHPNIHYNSNMIVAGGTYPDYLFVTGSAVNYGVAQYQNLTRASFYYDGSDIEVQIKGTGGSECRVYVDGYIAMEMPSPPADGNFWRHKLSFGTSKKRLLEFEFGGSVKIKEWVINPTATIWKCYKKTRAIFLGDSITEGTAGQFSQTAMNYAALCGRMLGWDDTWLSGVGSTGYVTSGGGGKVRLYDRIMTDVAPYSPDVVVVAMGINDPSNMTTEQIQPTLELIRAVIPVDSPIFVLGVWNPRSIDVSSRNNAIKAAVSKIEHCYYVDENYFTGTGRVGSLQNNGNSDKYISNDTTHPTQDGAEYMAIRTATSISSLLSRM